MFHNSKKMSRRIFLEILGSVAGSSIVYTAMTEIGLISIPTSSSKLLKLSPDYGHGLKVGIIGAGLAGLVTAYELGKLGYDCTVLEANGKAGGRCLTLRGGDRVIDRVGKQEVMWDREEHLYANMGPARIPHHHKMLLGYCQELGIPLEIFVNENRNAFVHDSKAFNGKRVRNKYFVNSTRGFISELLAKATNRSALDDVLTKEDKEKLLLMLKSYGELGKDYVYHGASRSGYTVEPGANLLVGELQGKASFEELLKAEFVKTNFNFTEEWNQAATMLQPVGGMDKIIHGFLRKVHSVITYNAPVSKILKSGDKAQIIYQQSGKLKSLKVDFVVVTVPFPVLERIETDFSPIYKKAMNHCHYTQAMKIAFQAERRFWEEKEQIFGGISWTDQDIGQIWYPSNALYSQKGIFLGAYIRDDSTGQKYAMMTFKQRLESAIACGEKIHENYRLEVKHGISLSWPQMPYTRGGWATWDESSRKTHYQVLTKNDGPLYLAGDQISYLQGWQEGSVLSAHAVISEITKHSATY